MRCNSIQPKVIEPSGNKCHCGANAIVENFCEAHFCKEIEDRVQATINRFSMFSPSDKIVIAYSGGKDSTLLLYLLKKLGYDIEAVTLNAYIGCYSKENLKNAISFCNEHNIKLHHVSFRKEFGCSLCYLRSQLKKKGFDLKSCSICGVLRRYLLNKYARAQGKTKIAFGHNMDDEVQSILMNLLKGSPEQLGRIGPIAGMTNNALFVQRVKPLYLVTEQEVIAYSKIKGFSVHYGPCPCSIDSFRYFVREFLKSNNAYSSSKRGIIELFLKLKPMIMKSYKTEHALLCSKCGEPAAHGTCRACMLIAEVAA